MAKFSLPVALLFMMPLSMPVSPNDADPLYVFCRDDTSNYTLNSPFESNLEQFLEILPFNTSLTGFFNNSVGDGSDTVYGRALCRGDINSSACQDCVGTASKQILNECNHKEAIIWYELCQVQYSYRNFFSSMDYAGKYPERNNQEANIRNQAHFQEVLDFLINNISAEAAFDPAKRMFATGEVKYSDSRTIYGLVQCTRDISNSDCNNCLRSSLGDLKACCGFRQGGIIVSSTCNVRFELNQFYNGPSGSLLVFPTSRGDDRNVWVVVAVVCTAMLILAIIIWSSVVYYRWKKGTREDEERSHDGLFHEVMSPVRAATAEESNFVGSQEFPFINLATVRTATDNFSCSNKLGQGGFGIVYKGILPNGKEVAIKRLSRKSWQGLEELKNEISLIAELQHRNLVRMLGCVIEGEEKLLVYEFMHNRSLDVFIFDPERRFKLSWRTCYNIINGIAKGLLYLHEDSRLKIIHRDLKPNNVLLDNEMEAKISDFGMARIFGENQNTANTRRVVGTYGYMAPEYAMEGLFSMKSDVFSFGVILLEIISGKRNSGFYLTKRAPTLLAYAWRLWNEGKQLELLHPSLAESHHTLEVLRCVRIGLLCVQEDPADRPTMSDVVILLGTESISLPEPRQPAFFVSRLVSNVLSSTNDPSTNQITISDIAPR